jgi:uncharacterized protein
MAGTFNDTPVAYLDEQIRTTFIVKVYQHLALALVAFVAFEVVLFQTGLARSLYDFFWAQGGASWLLLLGGVAIVNWFAAQAAYNIADTRKQYLGLFAVAFGQAVIFAPFLYAVLAVQGSAPVVNAVWITGLGFAGLTAVAWITRTDLSFLRPLVMWGFIAALVLIVAAVLFGMNLGTLVLGRHDRPGRRRHPLPDPGHPAELPRARLCGRRRQPVRFADDDVLVRAAVGGAALIAGMRRAHRPQQRPRRGLRSLGAG